MHLQRKESILRRIKKRDIMILDDMLNIKLNYCNPIRVLYVKDVGALEQERHYELRKSSRNRQVHQRMA